MREGIEQLATTYATGLHSQQDSENGQRSILNPVLFLFVGDDSLEALQAVYALNERQWENHAGALYLHAGTGCGTGQGTGCGTSHGTGYSASHGTGYGPGPGTSDGPGHSTSPTTGQGTASTAGHADRIYTCPLPRLQTARHTLRRDLYQQFYERETLRIEMNKIMKKVSIHLAEAAKHCPQVQHVNLAVVARADDPATVLMPELVLLMKSYLAEVFKYVTVDLYTLIQEKSSGEEFGFSASLGVSFLEELTAYQESGYRFREVLQVTEDHVTLEVAHEGPLFSLMYLLSDKNERGLFADRGQQENYELISRLVLLNNKPAESELEEGNESYNKHQFTRSIGADSGHAAFATAGLSRVRQPREAIALTVLAHVCDDFLQRMKETALPDMAELLEELELTPRHIQREVRSLLPDGSKLDEMSGLMTAGISYAELMGMTLKEAEQALFRGSSQAFFDRHFAERARSQLEHLQKQRRLTGLLRDIVVDEPRWGLYAACLLTSAPETGSAKSSIRAELLARIRETTRLLEETRAEWEELYRERVEQQDWKLGGIFTREKERVRSLIRHLLPHLYEKRYELLGLELELELLKSYEQEVEELHDRLRQDWERLEALQRQLRELAEKHVSEASDYLGKNIHEYYGMIAREALASLEARRGPFFYWEDRSAVPPSRIVQAVDASVLIERLTELCRREIWSRAPFALPFEDELLARANVAVAYENREVLTKEELFADLYRALEERAAVHVEIFHFSQKHRYEEKYFFADNRSEFIQYVIGREQGIRTCKQGYLHEAGKSGIEKLNLMGGFAKNDLMYYRNNKKYYDSYVANGFAFHRREEGVSI